MGVDGLVDRFGRVATDLRVSLTDRCNLRCSYCMPAEGLAWLPREELLTDEEVVRLVGVAVRQLGVREVRFTGGEPLLRPGLVGIIAACAQLLPRPELSLTTNGLGLTKLATSLAAICGSCLQSVRRRYRQKTRRSSTWPTSSRQQKPALSVDMVHGILEYSRKMEKDRHPFIWAVT